MTLICFDTSIWSASFNKDATKDLRSINRWMERIVEGEAKLLVPSIVMAEVAANPDANKVQTFKRFLLNSFVDSVDITTGIAEKAGELRRRVINDGRTVHTPDALIAAAAEHHHCDYLFSFDSDLLRMDRKYLLSVRIVEPSFGLSSELPFMSED